MTAPRTARARARAELTKEIKDEARRQLAEVGAHGLSLRAVARELGMVSSALYRYFASRDQLLTALIIDAYDAIGDAADAADQPSKEPRERWRAIWQATRTWAKAHPHEYALIYGSPVPGYRAPEATIGPAARVPLAFAGLVGEALSSGELTAPPWALPVTGALAEQAAALSVTIAALEPAPAVADVPPDALVRAVMGWTQLYGMISFELFGQLVGSFEPADDLFAHTVVQLAAFVGLR